MTPHEPTPGTLFVTCPAQRLPTADDSPVWLARGLVSDLADHVYEALSRETFWEQHVVRLFGRAVAAPRLSCWMGDSGANYRYSGQTYVPVPWSGTVSTIRTRIESVTHGRFNSCLLNWYRHGADSMGWHSDDEPELGAQPLIASVSLGAERRFVMRLKKERREKVSVLLGHGDVLWMGGATQREYQHALPKTARPCGGRINLTFRWVGPET